MMVLSDYKPIARFFVDLDRQQDSEAGECDLTHLKLQKLLYYAQGWALVDLGKPLFSNSIYAWQHGPVVKEAYFDLKPQLKGEAHVKPEHLGDIAPCDDEAITSFLKQVYDTYGIYSAWALRTMTHDEDPWRNAYLKGDGLITHDALVAYFGQLKQDEAKA